jgi:hypothetical protein
VSALVVARAGKEQYSSTILIHQKENIMQPHQQRVVDEKTELDKKRAKLFAFSETEIFASLPQQEKDRLEHQGFHMGAYSDILCARIAEFV